ncbi:MAG: hypothetical protein RLY16_890 [Bacteroidota bacterium]|jgi:hypothetical protein
MPKAETLYSKGFQLFTPFNSFQKMEKRSDFSLFFGKKSAQAANNYKKQCRN